MSKNKDAKHRAKRFREEGLGLGAWQGRAGRGRDGEDQGKMTSTCDRCHRKDKTFRIPWTGDHLCKDCIDQDGDLQQMFAEIDSMVYDQQLHDLGIPTDLPDGMNMPVYIIEPDDI